MFYPRFQNQIYKVDAPRRQPDDRLPTKEGGAEYTGVESKLGERKVAAEREEGKGKYQDPPEVKDVPEWQDTGVSAQDADTAVAQSKGRRKSVKEKVKGVFGRKREGEGDIVR